jgi:hypothetical protein
MNVEAFGKDVNPGWMRVVLFVVPAFGSALFSLVKEN